MPMHFKKTLTLREIQKIANTITLLKGSKDKDGNEIYPNYTEKWDASTQYWMGRLAQFCEPITERITETRNSLIKKFGRPNKTGGYDLAENDQEFSNAIKEFLDAKDTIRFPELKASSFVKRKDKTIEETLVPLDFWQHFSEYLIMDIKEFEVEKDERIEESETANG